MQKGIDLKDLYKKFVKKYRRFIPDFYNEKDRIDIFPLISYYRIY